MKMFRLLPLLLLTACSTAPRLALHPQSLPADASAVRYPEVIHAYHVGRYADPNDDRVMHEQHAVYRVEENTRWDFHPGPISGNAAASTLRDAAFNPAPVNEAILTEVNSQRLATAQILAQARTLSSALAQFQSAWQQTRTNLEQTAALRATVNDMQRRLDALATAPAPPPSLSTTSQPADPPEP